MQRLAIQRLWIKAIPIVSRCNLYASIGLWLLLLTLSRRNLPETGRELLFSLTVLAAGIVLRTAIWGNYNRYSRRVEILVVINLAALFIDAFSGGSHAGRHGG